MKIVAIDFETANNSPASICAVGLSTMEEGSVEETYETLIRPDEGVGPFSPWNIQIHRIQPEDVCEAPSFPEVYDELLKYFQDSIITAHNAAFDMGCLKATCRYYGLPLPAIEYFDTLEISRSLYPTMHHHRLNDMCEALHIELNHHNALSDSYGALCIVAQSMNLSGVFDLKDFLQISHCKIRQLR